MNWKWTKEQGQDYLTCKAASAQLRYAAILEGRVVQFAHATYEPEMQVKTLTEEGVQSKLIPPKIKLTEIGRGIQLSQDYVPPQSFDLQDPVQKHLVWQLRNVLDHCSLDALRQGSADIITSATTLMSVIQRAKWTGIEALCGIISGFMCSRAEPYDRTHYIGIGGFKLLRAVKRHPKFLPWQKYLTEGNELFLGEEGATNNIRWVGLKDISLSLLRNEGVVFGHQGLWLKEAKTPNLRLSEGTIAWYGILALGSQNVLHIPERKRRWA